MIQDFQGALIDTNLFLVRYIPKILWYIDQKSNDGTSRYVSLINRNSLIF